ncbi:hypothetical protein [Actinomadura sp. 9N215]|uniref:hypothetical protein n=1 Tax=Actinomadura sp. 9N215 TaxID=3375150 RepID=UPI00378AE22C
MRVAKSGLGPAEGLADLDVGGLVVVVDGFQDGEDGVVVALDFWALVGVDGVLDGQRMELDLLLDEVELLGGRLEQAIHTKQPRASLRASSKASLMSPLMSPRWPSR